MLGSSVTRRIVCCLVFAGVVAVGCERSISVDEFVVEYPSAYCHMKVTCELIADVESCNEIFDHHSADGTGIPGPLEQAAVSFDAGFLEYDYKTAARCLDKLWQPTCLIGERFSECASVFSGTIPTDGQCFFGRECISGICQSPGCGGAMCCEGVCVDRLEYYAANGESCVERPCDPGQGYCDEGSICRPYSAVGEPCSRERKCIWDMLCLGATEDDEGVCAEHLAVAEGDECSEPIQRCESTFLYCKRESGVCERKQAVGESCETFLEPCVFYAHCSLEEGKCVMNPLPGDPCPNGYPYCAYMQCSDEGLCEPRPNPGVCER